MVIVVGKYEIVPYNSSGIRYPIFMTVIIWEVYGVVLHPGKLTQTLRTLIDFSTIESDHKQGDGVMLHILKVKSIIYQKHNLLPCILAGISYSSINHRDLGLAS